MTYCFCAIQVIQPIVSRTQPDPCFGMLQILVIGNESSLVSSSSSFLGLGSASVGNPECEVSQAGSGSLKLIKL